MTTQLDEETEAADELLESRERFEEIARKYDDLFSMLE